MRDKWSRVFVSGESKRVKVDTQTDRQTRKISYSVTDEH